MAYGSTSLWLERGSTSQWSDKALSRSTVAFSGEHYQLPLPDGAGKPLKLTIAPISEHIPIYLAAVGPKNLELAGELADGWLAIFYAPHFAPEQLERVRSGRARVGKGLDGFDVVPSVPLVVGADPRICADQVRGYAALYIGGMGSREMNFYNALAVRMGFGETAAMVQDLFLSQRHRDAMAAVPFDFIDQTSLLGDRDRIADAISAAGRIRGDNVCVGAARRLRRGEAQRPHSGRGGAGALRSWELSRSARPLSWVVTGSVPR